MHCATPANSSDKNYSHRIHFLAAEIKDNKHAFVGHTTVRASSIPDVRLCFILPLAEVWSFILEVV